MKITQDVRDYAAELGVHEDAAIAKPIGAKAVEFVQKDAGIYSKA